MTPTTKLLVNKTMSFCLNQKVITANKTKSTKEKFFEMYKSNPDLNKKEAGELLSVSRQTIYDWIKEIKEKV